MTLKWKASRVEGGIDLIVSTPNGWAFGKTWIENGEQICSRSKAMAMLRRVAAFYG